MTVKDDNCQLTNRPRLRASPFHYVRRIRSRGDAGGGAGRSERRIGAAP